jgi:glyoxylase-like metal-dependent hydrolase (beta-lactamase superfamily II)
VQIKTAMQWGRRPAGVLRTLLDRDYTTNLPIHVWLIEHPDGPILVDTGELATTADPPIARFHVEPEDEIDRQLELLGLHPSDLAMVVLTHLHSDHLNGVARLSGAPVVASKEALSRGGARKVTRLGATPQAVELAPEPFGAFARSQRLTRDGRIVAVPVPGHARGQIAIIVVEDDHHVLIAGDSAYTQRQLLARHPDGVSTSARQAVRSMETILEHGRRHPTVFLPSHDPESASRLERRAVL